MTMRALVCLCLLYTVACRRGLDVNTKQPPPSRFQSNQPKLEQCLGGRVRNEVETQQCLKVVFDSVAAGTVSLDRLTSSAEALDSVVTDSDEDTQTILHDLRFGFLNALKKANKRKPPSDRILERWVSAFHRAVHAALPSTSLIGSHADLEEGLAHCLQRSSPSVFLGCDALISFVQNSAGGQAVTPIWKFMLSLPGWEESWANILLQESKIGAPKLLVHPDYDFSTHSLLAGYQLARFSEVFGRRVCDLDFILDVGGGHTYGHLLSLAYRTGFTGSAVVFDTPLRAKLTNFLLRATGEAVYTASSVLPRIGAGIAVVDNPGSLVSLIQAMVSRLASFRKRSAIFLPFALDDMDPASAEAITQVSRQFGHHVVLCSDLSNWQDYKAGAGNGISWHRFPSESANSIVVALGTSLPPVDPALAPQHAMGYGPSSGSVPYFGEFFKNLMEARGEPSSGGESSSEFAIGLLLFSLATSIRATNILEVGRFTGFSTLALGSALRFQTEVGWHDSNHLKQRPGINYKAIENKGTPRRLFSVEPYPTLQADSWIKKANLTDYVVKQDVPSRQARVDEFPTFDMMFIDGDHAYEQALWDMRTFFEYLRPGGLMVVHDYYGWFDGRGSNNSPVMHAMETFLADGVAVEHVLIDTNYPSAVVFRKLAAGADLGLGPASGQKRSSGKKPAMPEPRQSGYPAKVKRDFGVGRDNDAEEEQAPTGKRGQRRRQKAIEEEEDAPPPPPPPPQDARAPRTTHSQRRRQRAGLSEDDGSPTPVEDQPSPRSTRSQRQRQRAGVSEDDVSPSPVEQQQEEPGQRTTRSQRRRMRSGQSADPPAPEEEAPAPPRQRRRFRHSEESEEDDRDSSDPLSGRSGRSDPLSGRSGRSGRQRRRRTTDDDEEPSRPSRRERRGGMQQQSSPRAPVKLAKPPPPRSQKKQEKVRRYAGMNGATPFQPDEPEENLEPRVKVPYVPASEVPQSLSPPEALPAGTSVSDCPCDLTWTKFEELLASTMKTTVWKRVFNNTKATFEAALGAIGMHDKQSADRLHAKLSDGSLPFHSDKTVFAIHAALLKLAHTYPAETQAERHEAWARVLDVYSSDSSATHTQLPCCVSLTGSVSPKLKEFLLAAARIELPLLWHWKEKCEVSAEDFEAALPSALSVLSSHAPASAVAAAVQAQLASTQAESALRAHGLVLDVMRFQPSKPVCSCGELYWEESVLTGAKSDAVVTAALAAALPLSEQPLPVQPGLFGAASDNKDAIAAAASALDDEGVLVFGQQLPKDTTDRLASLVVHRPALTAQVLAENTDVQSIAVDPVILSVAQQFLQAPVRLTNIELTRNADSELHWHQAKRYPHWLQVYVYINDVDESNQPLQYVKRSLKNIDKIAHAHAAAYSVGASVGDATVAAAMGSHSIAEVVAAAGTVVFLDPRGLHRLKSVGPGTWTQALVFSYTSSLYEIQDHSPLSTLIDFSKFSPAFTAAQAIPLLLDALLADQHSLADPKAAEGTKQVRSLSPEQCFPRSEDDDAPPCLSLPPSVPALSEHADARACYPADDGLRGGWCLDGHGHRGFAWFR